MLERLQDAFGIGAGSLDATQMALRAVVVYLFAIALIRLGHKRFLGRHTAFDAILGFILGSVLSRAITGNAPFGPALVTSAVLVGVHWMFAVLTFRSPRLARLVDGRARVLVRDGEVQRDELRASQISDEDLAAGLRINGGTDDPADVRRAHLELDGSISVLSRDRQPRVVEVRVEQGVQTVRIRME